MIYTFLFIEWLFFLFNPNFPNSLPSNQIEDDNLKIIEKVYLHTDRDYYYSGDDIWFKAYLIDASNNQLTNHSNNLHVELISTAAKVIDSRVVKIENGLGNGDFSLPRDLPSGQYRLRAYTNYMRNFGDRAFLIKDISIFNPLDSIDSQEDSKVLVENKIEITFFPEGGSLVDNVSSIVAFKAADAIGKGCDVSGEVYSSEEELITSFKSAHQGMGSFVLKPQPGLKYYAIVKNESGLFINTEIPKSFSTGVTQSVTKDEFNNLIVTIRTNEQTLPLIRDKDLILVVSAHNIPFVTINFRIKSLNNKITISSEEVPDGIVMLTLSSVNEETPLCERLVFLQNDNNANLQIETNKMTYHKRDSVSINITLKGDSIIGGKGFLSLSAAEDISSNGSSQYLSTISSWFLLESDIRGLIENPGYYFDRSNQSRLEDLDLLLMTQGWRDFEWKYENANFLPEHGFVISGRLRKILFDRPLEGSQVNLGLFGEGSTLITIVPTDSLGKFLLSGLDFNGELNVVASSVNEKEKLGGAVILDSLNYVPHEIGNNYSQYTLLIKGDETSFSEDSIVGTRGRRKFNLSDTIVLDEVKIVSKKNEKADPQSEKIERDRFVYGTPDNELIITPNLESYPNALEAIRGRIPGVVISGSYPNITIRIRGQSSLMGSSTPLFVIDGVPSSLDVVMTLPVSWIDRIDILKGPSAARFGMQGFNGVIAIISRTTNRPSSINNPSTARMKIVGYDAPRVFYSPQYTTNSNPVNSSDIRTTLFWDPDIILEYNKDTTLFYFNADYSSTIKITVEGITNNGIPVSTKATYKVN